MDFKEIFRHIAAIIFMVYFTLICRYVGLRFVNWRGIVLQSYAAKLVIPIFLGIIILTYLIFAIGIMKLLYFQLLFGILLIILFFGFEYNRDVFELKDALRNGFLKIKEAPWRVIFITIITGVLFYNLSYSFLPAVYFDGSGDIENSYLPNLNGYIISHSFKAPIQNSTNGINSQAIDVLRTVAKIFVGEPGVYLLSFVYLLLFLGGVYLIGKEFFNINNILIYMTILLLVSENLFTEGIHFGKLHIAGLSFLMISLYSAQFFRHDKNYILPALFFAFLATQYLFFTPSALVYYLFVFAYFCYKDRVSFNLFTKSFIVFGILVLIFPLKLIFEVGVFLPPWAMPWALPKWLSNFFWSLNQNNELYKYIDNNYIRYFCDYHHLAEGDKVSYRTALSGYFALLPFPFIFLFLPLLELNVRRVLYIIVTIVIFLSVIPLYPSPRVAIYYAYPFLIMQFGVINALVLKLNQKLNHWISRIIVRDIIKGLGLIVLLFIVLFKGMTLPIAIKGSGILKTRCGQERSYFYRFYNKVLPVFLGLQSKYHYLELAPHDSTMDAQSRPGAERYFDHAMLIRQYTDPKDTILIVPVRFHSHTMRFITARHALGSVIYQKGMNKIMVDLKRLNIKYLSTIPINYKDYNPFYTPLFEEDIFYKYFKLIFSANGNRFYKIIYDGTNTEYTPSPYNVKGLPFVPMLIE